MVQICDKFWIGDLREGFEEIFLDCRGVKCVKIKMLANYVECGEAEGWFDMERFEIKKETKHVFVFRFYFLCRIIFRLVFNK